MNCQLREKCYHNSNKFNHKNLSRGKLTMNQILKQAFEQASQLSLEAQNAIAQIILNEIKQHQTNQEQKLNLSNQKNTNLSKEYWDQWFEEVEKIELISTDEDQSNYQKILFDKYKKQGLEL